MQLSNWIADVADLRNREYLADPDPWMSPPPGLRPGATAAQLLELESWTGQPLEETYTEFLRQSDGMGNFLDNMPIFGWCDWQDGKPPADACEFRDMMQGELCVDAGLPPDVPLTPLSVNEDVSVGVFMIPSGVARGRIFWTGNGDRAFFPSLRSLFECAVDPLLWGNYAAQ